jgi:hypothetical protein
MKRSLFVAAGAVAVAALSACAHGNGSSSGGGSVRVVTNAQDVASCEKLSNLRLSGTWTTGAAKEELERLVKTKGGNVLLIGSSTGATDHSGVAYRCSGGTTSGTP